MTQELCKCGVPNRVHGTMCGWESAILILNPKDDTERNYQEMWLRAKNMIIVGNQLLTASPNISQNVIKCDILENDSKVSDVAKPVTETIEVDDLNEKIEELELKLEEKTRHCSEWAKKAVEAGNRASELQRKLSSIKEIEVWKEIEIKEGCEFPPLDDEGVFCLSDSDKYHLRFSDEEEREKSLDSWRIKKWLKKVSIPVSGGDLKNDYEASDNKNEADSVASHSSGVGNSIEQDAWNWWRSIGETKRQELGMSNYEKTIVEIYSENHNK